MTLKEFINTFDYANPDWDSLPEGWSECDADGLTSEEIGKLNAMKTAWELSKPERPAQRSRVWSDPEGYKWLVQWSNAVLLRFLIRLLTDSLPKSEYRRKAQLDDAARSSVRNIEEGYKRQTTSEYLEFISYSQGSLEEVKGDVRELTEDGFLKSKPGSALVSVGIDLGAFHRSLKESRGRYRSVKEDEEEGGGREARLAKPWDYHPLTVLYPPLKDLRTEDLTYEMFLELINKTDWLLRKLVESLEQKLRDERKGYQIGQARIRDKFKKNL